MGGRGVACHQLLGPRVDHSPGRRPPSRPWRRCACPEQIRGADCLQGEVRGCPGGDWSRVRPEDPGPWRSVSLEEEVERHLCLRVFRALC